MATTTPDPGNWYDELPEAIIETPRTFPAPPEYPLGTPVHVTGIVILTYLVASQADGIDCYGLLTDDQLESAQYASAYIVTAPEILPLAVDRISEVRHRITKTLTARTKEKAERIAHLATGDQAPAIDHYGPGGDTRPNDGPMAPLSPRPIAPGPGSHARPDRIEPDQTRRKAEIAF